MDHRGSECQCPRDGKARWVNRTYLGYTFHNVHGFNQHYTKKNKFDFFQMKYVLQQETLT